MVQNIFTLKINKHPIKEWTKSIKQRRGHNKNKILNVKKPGRCRVFVFKVNWVPERFVILFFRQTFIIVTQATNLCDTDIVIWKRNEQRKRALTVNETSNFSNTLLWNTAKSWSLRSQHTEHLHFYFHSELKFATKRFMSGRFVFLCVEIQLTILFS